MRPEASQIVVNLGETPEQVAGEYPTIPEGLYATKVTDAKLEETKQDGWPMVTYTLTIQDGEYLGRLLWHRRPLIPPGQAKKSTIGFAKADARALGLTVPVQATLLDLARFMVREGFGRLVAARVGFGRGEYADRNEVKGLFPYADLGEGYQSVIGTVPLFQEEDLGDVPF